MNKEQLITEAAQKCGLTKKQTAAALQAITQTIALALKNDQQVTLMGFGKFIRKTRLARTGMNPLTKKIIQIPEKKIVQFKPSKNI